MIICCFTHIERAIDDFVDEYEDAPDVYKLSEVHFTAWSAPEHCEFCKEKSAYLII